MSVSQITQLIAAPFGADEPMLHRALEAGGVGLWDYQAHTGQVDLYHNISAFHRLKPGRHRGSISDFAQFIFKDDHAALTGILAQCANRIHAIRVEFRVQLQSGKIVWLACNGQLAAHEREPVRYVGTIAEITAASEREIRVLSYHESLFSMARNPFIVGQPDFSKASQQIVQHCATTLELPRAGLWQFSQDRASLQCMLQFDAREHGHKTDGTVINATQYPAYFAAISRHGNLAVENAMHDSTVREFRLQYLHDTGVTALLDVALFHHGLLWGVLRLEACDRSRTWDSDVQSYTNSVVDLLILALEMSERARSVVALKGTGKGTGTREQHRDFIQTSLDSIWSADIDVPFSISLPAEEQIDLLRAHAHIKEVNPSFARDYQLEPDDVVGRKLSAFMPELFKGSSLCDWIGRDYRLIEREMRHKANGEEVHWLSLTLLGVLEDGKLLRLWGTRRNITERKRYQSLLENLAFRDPLTGLLNRQRLVNEINSMIELSEPQGGQPGSTLLLLDLNQFKDINDTLGHSAGDEVLRQMKTRLDEALLHENAIAARLGGDEFGVFARGIGTAKDAMRIGLAITNAMSPPFLIGGSKFHVSASIGAAIYPVHGRSFSELSRAADEAMYHAKQTGGSVRLFSRSTVVFERRKLLLLASLPDAIKRGELVLEYQPIIDCRTRKLSRMEALVRWQHPEYGRLTASDFVHKAEMSDSIRILTRWVIETATRDARNWQKVAPRVGISINISPRLLGDTNIVTHLLACIERFDLPAQLVDLEITETSLIQNPERASQILSWCRSRGFSIVIDDYGVGFCSLAYLRRLPLKGLKMDRSFVTHVMQGAEDAIIVQSTIALAHNLGLTVVAEGVEDIHTLQFLAENECDYAQGYGIAAPMSYDESLTWFQLEPADAASAKPASDHARHNAVASTT